MSALSLLCVSWREGRLALRVPGGDDLRHALLVCSPDERYDVRLRPHPEGGAWLVAPCGPLAAAVRLLPELDRLEPVDLPAGVEAPGLPERIADPSGALLVFDGAQLRVLAPGAGWSAFPLPDDLRPRAAALGRDGTPYVAGSRPARRLRHSGREAALVRWSRAESAFVPATPPLGWAGAARAVASDCFGAFDGVEATGERPVLYSGAGDPARAVSCVYVPGRRDWRVVRVPNTVRGLIRTGPDRLLAVTAEGDLLAVEGGQVRTAVPAATLHGAALAAATSPPPGLRLIVRGADAADDQVAAVAGLHTTDDQGALSWHTTAAVRSADGGATWDCADATTPANGEPELLDVALAGPA